MEHNQSNFGLDQCHDCGVRRKQVANPTTNYGFVLPTPTDLVTDLPADFDVALQGVDTRLKALQPGTTLGDLAYSSATANTNTRLGIGTTGQVLAVSGGVPAWTTPATVASGMTFIARTSFSNVASQAFDSVFTSTYKSYLVVIENLGASTGADDLQLQFRYAGPTTQASGYYGTSIFALHSGTAVSSQPSNNTTAFTIATDTGTSPAGAGSGYFYVTRVGTGSDLAAFFGQYIESSAAIGNNFCGISTVSRTYTGFLLKSSSTNITGTVAIYGLAAA
jgi:hypothetical protein